MALPQAPEARPFYQIAKQRFEDAVYLLDGEWTTGATYLAGYGVECMLKALVLNRLPERRRHELLRRFRGTAGHDLELLSRLFLRHGGSPMPKVILGHFNLVSAWSPDVRYKAGAVRPSEAKRFLIAVDAIMEWAERGF